MAGAVYDGPIIDAHHHLWDLRLNRHPWLAWSGRGDGLAPLQRNYLVDDYLDVSRDAGIVATVHVEANWEPSDPPGETAWLDTLDRPVGIAARYVAAASLAAPDAQGIIERQAANPRVAGIREIISWHPDPARTRITDREIMQDARWRAGLALLGRHSLSFDMLISPWQLADALRLASDHPDIAFVVNHCGSPMDRDEEGMTRWRDGLRELARADNVVLKLSDPVAYDPAWTRDSLAGVILHCIDCFGPRRCMFASDYPVAAMHIAFGEWIAVFGQMVAGFSPDEQRAMFFDCARATYGMPV